MPTQKKTYALLAACLAAAAILSASVPGGAAALATRAKEGFVSTASLLIQGRITAKQGAVVTIKTPDEYPGGAGIHAQFVAAGPIFRADVSKARILLPDGRRSDGRPLAVGDRVVMVLSEPDSAPSPLGAIGDRDHGYFATIVERIAVSDRMSSH